VGKRGVQRHPKDEKKTPIGGPAADKASIIKKIHAPVTLHNGN
jgi:hypothetical protein